MPLLARGDPGPPKIVEVEEKYSAIEGWLALLLILQTLSIIDIPYRLFQNKLLVATCSLKGIRHRCLSFTRGQLKSLKAVGTR